VGDVGVLAVFERAGTGFLVLIGACVEAPGDAATAVFFTGVVPEAAPGVFFTAVGPLVAEAVLLAVPGIGFLVPIGVLAGLFVVAAAEGVFFTVFAVVCA
jgi:hypothetical protein